ncbi:MAG: TetR/AcrR family transcriptional regulator [Lachnospiraceae bacterium]|nr:TetR/AcrR family transcriptional regulator [Lachnospiraceae bacterium]
MEAKEIRKPKMVIKRDAFLEKGYNLMSKNTIDTVSMQEVADASGYGVATLYRYFGAKPVLVVAIARWKWMEYAQINQKSRKNKKFDNMTAAQIYEFFLDSFLELYKSHKDLLRFNQNFNIYIQSESIGSEVIKPYTDVIEKLAENFRIINQKAKKDGTMRTDVSGQEIFSTSLHIMLAAVTRYAVGLVYRPQKGFDPVKELMTLKEMLMDRYSIKK